MLRIQTRRLVAAAAATALTTVATLVAGAAPAHAATSGFLLMKGTGSVYTANEIVNLGITPGSGTKTWSFKVVNTGSTSSQFKVVVSNGSPQLSATLLSGSKVLPNTYYTTPIAPGGNLVLTLKLGVAAGAPAGEYVANLTLRDPETNTALDFATADANATYQTGNKRNDLFVKSGSQPFVGGSITQFMTASAIRPGNTAAFVLRLKNDGGTPAAITLDDTGGVACASDFLMVIKDGTKNVTAAVVAGTYTTGVLSPGARKELKLSIKLLTATTCTFAYYGFTASGADGSVTSYAHIVTGV